MSEVENRLNALGISLPQPMSPVGSYVPYTWAGNLLHISGQVSIDETGGIKGVVGVDVSPERAREAAQMCAVNLLSQMRAAVGDLDRVKRVIKLNGFVQAGPDFYDIPKVLNGCSDLMVEAFGDAGRHARAAVGVFRLPLNFAVEVDAIVEAL
ncbi:MAG: RidA family protein [Alphaproteobacteria bacterium]